MTAKLFTEGEVETDEFLIVTEKQLALDSHHLEPTGRSSELLLLTLRKWEENHELRESEMIKNQFECLSANRNTACVRVCFQAGQQSSGRITAGHHGDHEENHKEDERRRRAADSGEREADGLQLLAVPQVTTLPIIPHCTESRDLVMSWHFFSAGSSPLN